MQHGGKSIPSLCSTSSSVQHAKKEREAKTERIGKCDGQIRDGSIRAAQIYLQKAANRVFVALQPCGVAENLLQCLLDDAFCSRGLQNPEHSMVVSVQKS